MPKRKKPSKESTSPARGQVRIIAGQWRGRKLDVVSQIDGLRPTPDRVRETLFNWLQSEIIGARCLDLFAGTGSLGLESLSRGAASVHFVELDASVCQSLRKSIVTLGAKSAIVLQTSSEAFVERAHEDFDIVFADPPYGRSLLENLIVKIDRLHPQWVYLEVGANESAPQTPGHWGLHRELRAGEVFARIYRIEPTTPQQ